jgi:hypothetical protein
MLSIAITTGVSIGRKTRPSPSTSTVLCKDHQTKAARERMIIDAITVPRRRKRLIIGDSWLMGLKILLVLLSPMYLTAQDETRVEGEIVVGPTLTTVGGGDDIDRYGGLGIGVTANFHFLQYGIGSIGITIPPMLVFGSRADAPGFDFQRLHLPIGVLFSFGDASGRGEVGSIGGAIVLGYGAMFGAFSTDSVDTRGFMSFDISLGLFERGMLKIRYSTVIGSYDFRGANVGYHGLFVIGSTAW